MFSAQDERLLGGKHCLHNLYKYLFFLYLSYFGVIMNSRVKRWTPTHLWNARSAFLCRTSCIPRKEAKKRVQLVSGMEDQGVFDKHEAHHKTYTFNWNKSNMFVAPACLQRCRHRAMKPRPTPDTRTQWAPLWSHAEGRVWVGRWPWCLRQGALLSEGQLGTPEGAGVSG